MTTRRLVLTRSAAVIGAASSGLLLPQLVKAAQRFVGGLGRGGGDGRGLRRSADPVPQGPPEGTSRSLAGAAGTGSGRSPGTRSPRGA